MPSFARHSPPRTAPARSTRARGLARLLEIRTVHSGPPEASPRGALSAISRARTRSVQVRPHPGAVGIFGESAAAKCCCTPTPGALGVEPFAQVNFILEPRLERREHPRPALAVIECTACPERRKIPRGLCDGH